MGDREEAIKIIQHSRQTHVDWKKWIEENPEEARQPKPEVETAGDVEWHQKCIEGYDLVLRVLQEQTATTG